MATRMIVKTTSSSAKRAMMISKKGAALSIRDKKSNNGRRKSGAGSDESRLMKRKEQNRAAQRAFRERKEKHVKDLEDKVAELQAQNDAANRENENMRDLLTRLQSENMALKQQPFTFQVPKPGQSSTAPSSVGSSSSPSTGLLSPPSTSFTSSFTSSQPKPANEKYTNPLDISSLQSFDPSVLDLLDAPAEPTATSHASDLDLGFKQDSGFPTSNFTTIANNPQYYSLSSFWDSLGSNDSTPSGSGSAPSSSASTQKTPDPNTFNFDMSNFSWGGDNNGTLDDLFGAGFGPFSMDHGLGSGLLGSSPASTSSLSPVVHMNPPQHTASHSPSSSSSSSSPQSDPSLFGTPRDGNSSASDTEGAAGAEKTKTCPKNRKECQEHHDELGMSPFVTQDSGPFGRKDAPTSCMGPGMSTMTDGMGNPMSMPFGPVVACQGSSSFPKTAKSDSNVEVLTAWRTITSNPRFKGLRYQRVVYRVLE
ncbi:hypothetical protein CYLTODRAFT_423764 [Cylindrobasidium torrendii FP15055 ss-10]|uniref:BZIP domain-containing protein n=1 Tax=Cylindrobasidium torrendii FP15055 ss-10 TaxID=1314674 RepID=A0A0D7B788_9AGAR|nr:hypothetical protein CYLTODRAFT_423764 [Cylindrobasidium torrendii FP15055 ss-10]